MITRRVDVHPCLDNIAWNSREADQLPADPVLGILQFTFHAGVDVSEPSQPASVLWRNSLKFVSTIPGFQRIYWAPLDSHSPYQQIIVLIQWDSGHGWKLFQSSLGFSMMLGYVESISNRCIRLALPANQFSFPCVLELVSFQFSATQIDKRPVFKSKWEAAFAPHFSNATAESGLTLLWRMASSRPIVPRSTLCWFALLGTRHAGGQSTATPRSQCPQSGGPYDRARERCNKRGLGIHKPAQSSVF